MRFFSGNAEVFSLDAMFVKKEQNLFAIVFLSDIFTPLTVKVFEDTVDDCLIGKTFLMSFQNLFGLFLASLNCSLKKVRLARFSV